jgi:arsenate reductase
MKQAVRLYGISNCDTIRKARAWLADHEIEYEFHDYRKQGADPELLRSMADQLGWEAMLNRRGTTWRKLPDSVKESIDESEALQLMQQNPAVIKRPILARGDRLHIGFNDQQYRDIFA